MQQTDVVSKLDGLLEPLGFKRMSLTWNRSGKVAEVIEVQKSKAGDSTTINAGVLDRHVYELLWGNSPPDFVEEPACIVRARIGELIDGKDRWWPLTDVDTGSQVVEAVRSHILPFLQRMQSREAMENWLVATNVVRGRYPPPILSLAIIRDGLGKRAEALELLSELKKKATGAWSARITAVDALLRSEWSAS